MTEKNIDVFPITAREHNDLIHAGWESGFGWENEFDYFLTPSNGNPVWVEDDPENMRIFLDHLAVIRARHAESDFRERVAASAYEIVAALEGMVYVFRENLNNVDCGPDYDLYQDAVNALKKARGETE